MYKTLIICFIVAVSLRAVAQSTPKQIAMRNVVHLGFPKPAFPKEGYYYGSGFLLDNGILMTCAHNVYRTPNNYIRELTIALREQVAGGKEDSVTLSADYIMRNMVTSDEFEYVQRKRTKLARQKYDYAFIRISDADMQRLQPTLSPAEVSPTPPVTYDSLYFVGYPASKLFYTVYGPGAWVRVPEQNDAVPTDSTRMWYNTEPLAPGGSGSPLLQIRNGKAILVGVHTDQADAPSYQAGNLTAGVANWSKFYEAYQAALQKPGR